MDLSLWFHADFFSFPPGGSPCGVIDDVLDFDIMESDLRLQSNSHDHSNTLGKGMNPLILPGKS